MVKTRRQVLHETTAAAAIVAAHNLIPDVTVAAESTSSGWADSPDRPWLGAGYWTNPLQDWAVQNGQAVCHKAAAGRSVHSLTHQLGDRDGTLSLEVLVSRPDDSDLAAGEGSAGFRIGILGTTGQHPELRDYRNNLAFSSGLDAGFTADGALFIGPVTSSAVGNLSLSGVKTCRLQLELSPTSKGFHELKLTALHGASGKVLGEVRKGGIPGAQLIGNLALAANFGPSEPGGKAKGKGKAKKANPANARNIKPGVFAFRDWKISGSKVDQRPEQRFGPILFNHYTVHQKKLKMSVQLPPLGKDDSKTVELEIKQGDQWKKVATADMEALSRTALFEVHPWDDSVDIAYRLSYSLKTRSGHLMDHYEGVIRRDPVDQETLSVADVSCNIHQAFPNQAFVASVGRLNPDLLAFVGDQFYESTGGFGIEKGPLDRAAVDYLRKWYFHGWTWRDLTKDRPSICLPDDHDVYQGNLWGLGGEAQKTTQEAGGYELPPEWVNVVHRTQTCHHPAPYDPKPGKQGITNYYGEYLWGKVSFAIVADRQYKSAPEGVVPPTGDRGDHVIDMSFDPKKADIPGLDLLGQQQVEFLEKWATQWKGADMKAVVSQTIFTGMATTHGSPDGTLRIDYDQNGWPQGARNVALRAMRKAFAFHVAGDQHLPAVVHYGIDDHRDAGVAFAGPAVNVGYRRWWRPTAEIHGLKPGQGLTGDFTDHFGHPMTVLAVVNGPDQAADDIVQNVRDRTSGFGIVTFNKKDRTIRMDCWPWGVDFSQPAAEQYPTWPVTVKQWDNHQNEAQAQLPTIKVKAEDLPVVQLQDAKTGEIIYTVRAPTGTWRPPVFQSGSYKVIVSLPETGRSWTSEVLEAVPDNRRVVEFG